MSLENIKLPKFGFGLMRLPETEEGMDIPQISEMVDVYMDHGMNYFDTAYVYDGGRSEEAVKEALVERYPRDSFYLATKLPAWSMKDKDDRDRILNESMERMGVDYIDFYLLHSVEDGKNYDTYEALDCFEWGKEKKKEGKIKHFGFSFHGTPELLEEILDKHPEIEFVQIQLNYADWESPIVQSGRLYEVLKERGIPTIVMEPVKGGILANPEPEVEAILMKDSPDSTPAELALRYVGSFDGVSTILSGMKTLEQMKQNVETFTNFKPLTEEERSNIEAAVKKMNELPTIECTACEYCVEGCPMNIKIPKIFKALNSHRLYPKDNRPRFFYNSLVGSGESARASECVECAQCEGVCPQHLGIVEYLKEAAETFDA